MNRVTEYHNPHIKRLQIPEELERKLKILLLKYPNGIIQNELMTLSSEQFGEMLNFREHNASTLMEFCTRLPHIFKPVNTNGRPAFFPACCAWRWPYEQAANDVDLAKRRVPEVVQTVIEQIAVEQDPNLPLTDAVMFDEFKKATKSGDFVMIYLILPSI